MKRLACFLLEGLVEQGPHRVWVTLGTFESCDAAQAATRSDRMPSVVDTRIIALYRDNGVTTSSNRRTHLGSGPTTAAENSAGFTVA